MECKRRWPVTADGKSRYAYEFIWVRRKLGEVCQKLPHKVQEHGIEVRTFMPKYGCINERRNQLHEVIRLSGMNLVIDDTDHPLIIKVATLQASRMQVYFIDNEDFFQHHAVSDLEIKVTPEDNDERMMFFVRGVMETVKKLRWEPFVVHCSGWVTALAPMYMKKLYADDPTIGPAKIVYSIFDDSFEGTLDPRWPYAMPTELFRRRRMSRKIWLTMPQVSANRSFPTRERKLMPRLWLISMRACKPRMVA